MRVNDFETVREALSDYLGSLPSAEDWTTPEDDVINAANAALDRIEAEVERLRAALEQIEHAFGRIARAALAKEEA